MPGNDIKQVENIAHRYGMPRYQRREFGDFIEHEKRIGQCGSKRNGDFTFGELDKLAQEFLENQ